MRRARAGVFFPIERGHPVREAEIRDTVVGALSATHPDPSDTLIVHELAVCCGEARVDVAAVNGKLSGYEIKSAGDTLVRLPRQAALYGRVMDEMTLVCAAKHTLRAAEIVPRWWALTEINDSELAQVRDGTPNPSVDAVSVLLLLWRQELIAAARARSIRGIARCTRLDLATHLAAVLPLEEVRCLARGALKSRGGWRSPR